MNNASSNDAQGAESDRLITFFLCGDVMTGRGIDQVLPHPSDPVLFEPYVKNAGDYVRLAEEANGLISKPVSYAYIWGDARDELEKVLPDARIINLETSITSCDAYWTGKGINYRMHPKNIDCITAAGIDLCALANNHVLDWGYPGLLETLETLKRADVKSAGAGLSLEEAGAPAVMEIDGKGRAILLSLGTPTSGIPLLWAASKSKPGINLLDELSDKTIGHIEEKVKRVKQKGDVVIASIHWGDNWGYRILPEEIEFAHNLIERAEIDIIHGHSSHHVKGIEVYRGKLILYGCGDFLNDYEGISGYEEFRDDLGLMYFATMDPLTGKLHRLRMTPTQIRNFKVNRASRTDARRLRDILNREGKTLGTRVDLNLENVLTLQWDRSVE
ncbi:MAG: CapA family protein [Desulfobacteraceae bacterium]|nr:MAG: CapA family protein [Desulfobacteraceae bacterium]